MLHSVSDVNRPYAQLSHLLRGSIFEEVALFINFLQSVNLALLGVRVLFIENHLGNARQPLVSSSPKELLVVDFLAWSSQLEGI